MVVPTHSWHLPAPVRCKGVLMRPSTLFHPLFHALAAAALCACGPAAIDPDEAAADAEEIRIGTGYRYDCAHSTANGHADHASIALTRKATHLTVVWQFDDGRTWVSGFEHDPSYVPKSTNANYARYNRVTGQEFPNSALVYLPLRTGASGGSVKLQSSDSEGYSSQYFTCKRTTAVLDTGEPAASAPSAAVLKALGPPNYGADPGGQTPEEQAHFVYGLTLHTDGTYSAINSNAVGEMGVWTASGSRAPITVSLQSGRYKWTGKATAGKVEWTRGSLTGTLKQSP
jgi:hypothetical protein